MYAQVYPIYDTMLAVADTISFADWLEDAMRDKGMSQAELARAAGVTRSAINGILTGRRGPGIDLCKAIAKALGLPPEVVFRAAGILPPGVNLDELTERIIYLAAKLGDYGKHLMIGYLEALVQEEEKKQISEVQNVYLTASPEEKRELDRLFDEWKKKKE